MAGLDLGHVQHLVDQAAEALGFADDDAQELLALGRGHVGIPGASATEEEDQNVTLF